MIAHNEAAHTVADRFDDACTLVAATEREMADGDVAGGEVVVGMAQAGRHHAYAHLVVARFIKLDRAHFPRSRHFA